MIRQVTYDNGVGRSVITRQVPKMEDLKTKVKSLYDWGFLYLA
jgi:hypothetical protein